MDKCESSWRPLDVAVLLILTTTLHLTVSLARNTFKMRSKVTLCCTFSSLLVTVVAGCWTSGRCVHRLWVCSKQFLWKEKKGNLHLLAQKFCDDHCDHFLYCCNKSKEIVEVSMHHLHSTATVRLLCIITKRASDSSASPQLVKSSSDMLHLNSREINSPTSRRVYSPGRPDRISQYVCLCSFPATPFTLSRNGPKFGSSFTVNLKTHTHSQDIEEKRRQSVVLCVELWVGLTWRKTLFPAVSSAHPAARLLPSQRWSRTRESCSTGRSPQTVWSEESPDLHDMS